MKLTWHQLIGLDDSFLTSYQGHHLHPAIVEDFKALQQQAKQHGLGLTLVSGHRTFERQKAIWNRKLASSNPDTLAGDMEQVLRFSALPGLSRHHWGCDMDLADQVALNKQPDYRLQLEEHEYREQGIFEKLGRWLKHELGQPECPFFRPYEHDLGGVAREPWHLSHKEISAQCLKAFDRRAFYDFYNSEHTRDLIGRPHIIDQLDTILERYFFKITQAQ